MRRRAWVIPFLLVAASCPGITSETTSFSASIERLSGPGGYFDTDNLISNERSYLHAISDLRDAGVQGGAYLGVGPDQNFSYIAEIRPELAVIVDIRPDNVLQHLIYKALFHTSQNRLEYLARLTGRPLPPDAADWSSASIDTILAYLDRAPVTEASRAEAMAAVEREIEGFGVRLTDAQRATIERFHGAFIAAGPALRFRSHGRAPQFYYPTYAELLREVDREGRLVSYVSTEARWRGVRELQLADRVIPIVGDLSGDVALAAVADLLEREDLEVSAFYTSNVEFYLFGDRTFGRFVENLRRLPLAEPSVLIKSFFRGFRGAHPLQEPGYYSTQLVQSATDLVEGWDEGRYRTYREVVSDGLVGVSTPATGPTPASSVPP